MDWYITKDNKEDNNINNDNKNVNINASNNNIDDKNLKKEFYLICEDCYLNNNISLPFDIKRENFELSSIYNLFSKEKLNNKIIDKLNEEKWTEEENNKLIEGIKNNNTWEEIIESLGNDSNKTKNDCILHLLQLPISNIELNTNNNEKEELMEEEKYEDKNVDEDENKEEQKEDKKEDNKEELEKVSDIDDKQDEEKKPNNDNNINIEKEEIKEEKQNNDNKNIIINEDKNINEKMTNNTIEIFMKLFRRYLNEKNGEKENESNGENILNESFKEVIYKTFVKSINKCKGLKIEEKDKMKNVVDILVYLEMKKIELKMDYFKQFEKVLEFKKNQIKTIQTQIIQERIQLLTKKFLLQQKQQQIEENK
jgi:hypothetical protein